MDLLKTQATAALKAQMHVRNNILKGDCKVEMKNNVAVLKAGLLKLLRTPVSAEVSEIYHIIKDREALVGSGFSQRWRHEGDELSTEWYDGCITEVVSGEFKLVFHDCADHFCFFTKAELIVDIVRCDLELTM